VPFRFFDVAKQGIQYDADTAYLLHYFPVFKDVPLDQRYRYPFLSSEERKAYGIEYPEPIVDFYKGLNLMKARYDKA
jgi:deoxyribodipyrimidine photolyase